MEFGQLQSQTARSLIRAMRSPRAGRSIPANDVISIIESAFFLQTSLTGGSALSLGCSRNAQSFRGVSPGESSESVRAKLDDGISQLKEIARLASLLYNSTNQSTAGPKSAMGPEADRVLCRLGIYRELGLSVDGVATGRPATNVRGDDSAKPQTRALAKSHRSRQAGLPCYQCVVRFL